MRKPICAVVVVLMLLAMAFIPFSNVIAQGSDPATVVQVRDHGLSTDDDEQYEYLVISFDIHVADGGRVGIAGTLLTNGLSPVVSGSVTKDLLVGDHTVEVMFESEDLYESLYNNSRIGFFSFDYTMTHNGTFINESEFTTVNYAYDEFDHPDNYPVTPAENKPKVEQKDNIVTFWNDVMTVNFDFRGPEFEWYYTNDNKSLTKFHCRFEAIHAYVDDGRHYFTMAQSTFKGELASGIRDGTVKVVPKGIDDGRSKSFGEYVTFSVLYANIPLIYKSSSQLWRLVNFTVTVTFAAGDMKMPIGEDVEVIKGGTQLRIHFGIELNEPLGADGIAVEQEIWSESSKRYHHDFKFDDHRFTEIKRESDDSTEKPYEGFKEPFSIAFVPKYTTTKSAEGIYFWFSRATVDGIDNSMAPMTYAYNPENKHLRMYLGFMTEGTSITSIDADLGLGLTKGSNPSLKKFSPPKAPEPPSILVTITGWVSAVCLAVLPLWIDFRRARQRLKELEEEYGEEL